MGKCGGPVPGPEGTSHWCLHWNWCPCRSCGRPGWSCQLLASTRLLRALWCWLHCMFLCKQNENKLEICMFWKVFSTMVCLADPPPAALASHLGTSSSLACSNSDPVLLWHRKAANGGSSTWTLGPTWETKKKVLASSFEFPQLLLLTPFGVWTSGLMSLLTLPSLYSLKIK